MGNNRRSFLKAGLLGGAVVATSGVTQVAAAKEENTQKREPQKPLQILVLGGTGFIGPHMVREALRRGHSVTLFNRGRTNSALFPDLETIKGDRGGDLEVLQGRSWDAVIDNSGYVPRHVQNSARTLANSMSHYLYVSAISTYASWAQPNDEDSPLATIDDETIEEVTGETYGPLKALCEKRAIAEIGEDRLTILRPTYICGPGDHTDRFSYWPVRTMKGGEMLWPGSPEHTTQIIDVRDLANFVVDCAEQRIMGTYNTVTPAGGYTMGDLLADSEAVTASSVEAVWVDESFIEEEGVASLPIWHARVGETAEVSSVSGARARAAGLKNRPVRETIRDLTTWWKTLPEERTKQPRAGLSTKREAELIAKWKQRQA
jgi:2'-hydroxyisoflavone reductase